MKKITDYIRWFLTILLIITVWFNAHWSVALCLTLITFFCEALVATLKEIIKK